MNRQFDALPDDFNVGRLLPPTGETQHAFEAVFADLANLAQTTHHRIADVQFSSYDTYDGQGERDLVEVYCSSTTISNARDLALPQTFSTLTVGIEHDGQRLDLNQTQHIILPPADQAIADGVVKNVANSLDEVSADWLQSAYSSLQLEPEALLQLSIEKLQDTSPAETHEKTDISINATFKDGSRIVGEWIAFGNEVLAEYPDFTHIRSISLTAADGTRYEYSKYEDGSEKLFVKKPGDRRLQVVDEEVPFELRSSYGLSIRAADWTELKEWIRMAVAEQRQAQELGLDTITDGKLVDFTQALRASLQSGVAKEAMQGSDSDED